MPGNLSLPLTVRFWRKVKKTTTCWLWLGKPNTGGYGRITLTGKDTVGAHVASWFLHHGTLPIRGICVLHKCDTPLCVNPAHLFLGTQSENIADMWAKGRANPRGGKPQRRNPFTGQFMR